MESSTASVTVRVAAGLVILASEAVILVVPGLWPVALPVASIDAAPVLELNHFTVLVITPVELSE